MATRIVLLPGLDGTGRLFDRFVSARPPGFETQVVSFPDESPLGYEELAARVRPQIPRERGWVLLGESFSGPLALRIAAERPRGLRAVVLCATFLRSPLPPALVRAAAGPVARGRPPEWALRWFLTGGDAALAAQVQAAVRCASAAVIEARIRAVADVDASDALRGADVPVLALTGTRDRLVPPRRTDLLRAVHPDVRVAPLDAPHLVLQAAPARAWDAIAAFLA